MKKSNPTSSLKPRTADDDCALGQPSFAPPWYLRNGHLQTVITGFYKPKPKLPPSVEHRIPLGAFGYSLVHENRPERPSEEYHDTAVMLLHGLGASHAGTYMTSMGATLLQRGVRVFRADLPGAGDSARFTPLPPHGACFDEVWKSLLFLRDSLGIRRWRVAGISLGGNILLKMAAAKREEIGVGPDSISIDRAVAVAPPIHLADCSRHMESGLHRIYAGYFMRALRKQAAFRATLWPSWAERLKDASFATIRRFDETMTAPLAGFRDADEYYETGSSIDSLHNIDIPMTILIDQHDPIVPASMFDGAVLSASTKLVSTRFGGHVGYLQRRSASGSSGLMSRRFGRWADDWIVEELLSEG